MQIVCRHPEFHSYMNTYGNCLQTQTNKKTFSQSAHVFVREVWERSSGLFVRGIPGLCLNHLDFDFATEIPEWLGVHITPMMYI